MVSSPPDLDTLKRLTAIVREAGAIALPYFKPGDQTQAKVTWKGDGSPVTEADFAVNVFLEARLRALWPDAAWLSEESADDSARIDAARVIVVDPIDGTRGFARGDRNWCIAVALVERGRPVIAVVHAPANGETYTALVGGGAALNDAPLAIPVITALGADARVSLPGGTAQAMRDVGIALDFRPKLASLALRIVGVASGAYHCCLASRDSHDWDLAAADLVLQEAGGQLAELDGQGLVYNKADTRHGVLIAAAPALRPAFIEALARAETAARGT